MVITKWAYFLAFLMPLSIFFGYAMRGPFFFFTPVFVFGLIPLVDLVVGARHSNFCEGHYKNLRDQKFFRLITMVHVPLQYALVIWGAYVATHEYLRWWEFAGFAFSLGIVTGGMGITVAHELGHRSNRLEQTLAKILLLTVSYMHFFIEHNRGHHVRMGTPADPATARLGESYYRFYFRTVIGSFTHAWHLETQRLARKGRGSWSTKNSMIWFVAAPIALGILLGAILGWMGTVFFFAQSLVAFSLLELVNYVEHYGLRRKAIAPGKYEKVEPHHSWNASEVVTNCLLFGLGRHSDHHASSHRRYQTLRHVDEAAQMPTGYAGMMLVALFPHLWRRIMDPRVRALST